jgi:hypothetical protein
VVGPQHRSLVTTIGVSDEHTGFDQPETRKSKRGCSRDSHAVPQAKEKCCAQHAVVFHQSIETRPARMLPSFGLDPDFSLFRTGLFPAWAPLGDRVILAESPGLLLIDVSRESVVDIYPSNGLYDSKGIQLAGAAWSPDGSTIALGAGAAFGDHASPAQIAIMKADGSGFRTITGDHGNAAFPSWSPDGKRIVYRVARAEQGLRIVNVEGWKDHATNHRL